MVEATFIKQLLIGIIIILVILNILFFLALTANHFIGNNKHKNKQLLKEKYTEIIVDILMIDKTHNFQNIKLKNQMEYETFAEVCIDLLVAFPDKLEKIHFLVFESGLFEYLKKASYYKKWDKKFYAIEKIGYLRIDALKEFFIEMYSSETLQEIKISLLISMSLVADIRTVRFITYAASKHTYLSPKLIEYIYTNTLKSLINRQDQKHENVIIKSSDGKYNIEKQIKEKNDEIQSFIGFLIKIKDDQVISKNIKISIIDAIGICKLEEAENVLIDYYYNFQEDIDIKSACLRAFGEFKSKNSNYLIVKSMEDSNWILRNISAKIAIKLGKDIIPNLNTLLYDKSYNVRLNSAKSLLMLGSEGADVLMQELQSEDKFVRNTVRFVIDIKDKVSYV